MSDIKMHVSCDYVFGSKGVWITLPLKDFNEEGIVSALEDQHMAFGAYNIKVLSAEKLTDKGSE